MTFLLFGAHMKPNKPGGTSHKARTRRCPTQNQKMHKTRAGRQNTNNLIGRSKNQKGERIKISTCGQLGQPYYNQPLAFYKVTRAWFNFVSSLSDLQLECPEKLRPDYLSQLLKPLFIKQSYLLVINYIVVSHAAPNQPICLEHIFRFISINLIKLGDTYLS